MKFLCDVHISYKLVNYLKSLNFKAFHVNDILDRWLTSDSEIRKYVDENKLILITKDSDFRDSYYIQNSPKKLIKINLGNISNNDLINVFSENIHEIKNINKNPAFIIEIDKENVYYNLPENLNNQE